MLRLNGLMALSNKWLVRLRQIPRLGIGSLTNLRHGVIEGGMSQQVRRA